MMLSQRSSSLLAERVSSRQVHVPPSTIALTRHLDTASSKSSIYVTQAARARPRVPKMTRGNLLKAMTPSAESDSHAGHAFLHDFCMSLPYSALALLASAILAFLGANQVAIPVAIGGAVVGGASVMSLKAWRAQGQTAPMTLLSGGVSAFLGYKCWGFFQAGIVPWLTGMLLALSGAMAVFALYNVAAGGNPPKR